MILAKWWCLVGINTSKTYTNYTYIIPKPNSTKRHQYRVQYGASTRSEWKSGSGAYSFAVGSTKVAGWVAQRMAYAGSMFGNIIDL